MVSSYGVNYLFYTVILMGIFQFVVFLLRGGSYVRLVPHTVMLGFVNGLGIVIALAQIEAFKAESSVDESSCFPKRRLARSLLNSIDPLTKGTWVGGVEAGWMLCEIVVCMGVMVGLGFIKNKYVQMIPSSLMGIISTIVVEFAVVRPAGFSTRSIGNVAKVAGNLPQPSWTNCPEIPAISLDLLSKIWLPALSMAFAGLIETMLTQILMDDITNWRTNRNREVFAQSFANVFTGCFGGMGGCAMIGQCMVNMKSGGFRRLSTLTAFVLFLIVNTAAYPAINIIPTSALVGVMWVICFHTVNWPSFRIMFMSALPESWRAKFGPVAAYEKIKRWDALIIFVVTVVTIVVDLFIAVAIGIGLSCVVYCWDSGSTIRVTAKTVTVHPVLDEKGEPTGETEERAVYDIEGPLFFGSTVPFTDLFAPKSDPPRVEIHCREMQIMDYSGLEAVVALGAKYKEQGKRLHLRFLRPTCLHMAEKAKGLTGTVTVEQLDERQRSFVEEELLPGSMFERTELEKKSVRLRSKKVGDEFDAMSL